MAKLRLKQFDSVLTGSLNVSGSLGVSGSALTIDGKGSVSGSALSSGSFGRLNSYTLDIDSIQGNWTNAGNTVADGGTFTTIDINGGTINGITDLAVADGGTGAGTFTDGGVLLGSGTDAITATAVLTNGQLLIGDNSGDPTIATLTGTSNQVTVTNGAGSITLSTPQNIHTSATPTFGTITTTGNVTGSSTSTGSFGELHIADKIGIGTTNPDNSSLHVAGHINLDDDKAVAWGGGSSRPAIIGNTSNNTLKFYTNGGERISVASSGEVGIGTANPTKALHVVGDALVTGILTAQEFHTEFVSASIQYTSGSTKFGDTTDDLHSITGSLVITGSSLTIDSVGGVSGSSTSTGSFGSLKISDAHQGDLLIQGDSSTAKLRIRPNVNTGDSELHFSRFNRDNAGFIEYGHLADVMNFYAAGPAIRFSLDSTGANVNQALSVGTNITVGGDISGSATTTATFGSYGGNISGSATSTGSFGRVSTAGDIYSEGRIFESGTSVIDHATAMAIVFGG